MERDQRNKDAKVTSSAISTRRTGRAAVHRYDMKTEDRVELNILLTPVEQ